MHVLAFLARGRHEEIERQLRPLGGALEFVASAADLSIVARNGRSYEVALLPATLPDADWWTVWGNISLLSPRPAILVYAPTASFQLWSGVLEAGGYDVIVEPFSDVELQEAVLRAADSFEHGALRADGVEQSE
jgi:CheY-like chemotaxis protein